MPVPDRKRRVTAFAVAMAVLIATPLAVVASDAFTDVPDSNVFHDDVGWLADAGITKGCNPPANTEFCPDDNVTREQMSAFMRRFAQYIGAEDGIPAKVDHAATADSATTADDSDNLAREGADAYRTIVEADYCLRGTSQSCALATDFNNPTAVLSVDIDAPLAGTVVIDSHLQPVDIHVKWLTIDDTCGTLAGPTPPGIPGTLSFNIVAGLDSGNPSSAVQVEAGAHTVTLCAVSSQAIALAGSLNVSWSAGTGGINLASVTEGSQPIDPAIYDAIREAFEK